MRIYTRLLVSILLFCTAALSVQAQNTPTQSHCGYSIQLTAIGKQIQGTLVPDANAGPLVGVEWRMTKGNVLLSESPSFTYDVANYGVYNVRVSFSAYEISSGQSICSCEMSQPLQIVESGCFLEPAISTSGASPTLFQSICPQVFSPVCGCDGITYANPCAAERAGASTWWAGECASQPSSTTCGTTNMSYKVLSGNMQTGYDVLFIKNCTGNFTNIQLDFGDGSPFQTSTLWDSLVHHYSAGGVFDATLSAWQIGQPACVSSVSKAVITDAASYSVHSEIFGTDYVQPGDANGDGMANVHDLIHLGLGYGAQGVPRPEASNDWSKQYAPNWPAHTFDAVNYKHLDCNGDGTINEFDVLPVESNYNIEQPEIMQVVPYLPCLHTNFLEDTIFINPNIPGTAEVNISADVHIGSSYNPVFDLYGISMSLEYPEYFGHSPEVVYSPEFFGSSNFILTMAKDRHDALQMDVGLTHKQGAGSSGYGNLARINFKADFIIIIDIIDRADNKVIPLTLPIGGVRTVDSDGKEVLLSAPQVLDTVWIKLTEPLTSANQINLSTKLQVYPNPASDLITVRSSNTLDVARIDVMNQLGQTIQSLTPAKDASQTRIDVKDWPRGLYTVRVSTSEGVTERKVVIQ